MKGTKTGMPQLRRETMASIKSLSSAYEIWNALSKAFYDGSDELQVFSLSQNAFTSKQNGKPLFEYYGELTVIFLESDHHDKVVLKDPDDVTSYRRAVDRLRTHIFLAGLDTKFEPIHGEILLKDPILELEECYALIRKEAIRHATLQQQKSNQVDKSSLMCSHYNKIGHTKTRCFEIVGYPEWWDHTHEPCESMSYDVVALNVESHNGMSLNNYVPVKNSDWIIDSGVQTI